MITKIPKSKEKREQVFSRKFLIKRCKSIQTTKQVNEEMFLTYLKERYRIKDSSYIKPHEFVQLIWLTAQEYGLGEIFSMIKLSRNDYYKEVERNPNVMLTIQKARPYFDQLAISRLIDIAKSWYKISKDLREYVYEKWSPNWPIREVSEDIQSNLEEIWLLYEVFMLKYPLYL